MKKSFRRLSLSYFSSKKTNKHINTNFLKIIKRNPGYVNKSNMNDGEEPAAVWHKRGSAGVGTWPLEPDHLSSNLALPLPSPMTLGRSMNPLASVFSFENEDNKRGLPYTMLWMFSDSIHVKLVE